MEAHHNETLRKKRSIQKKQDNRKPKGPETVYKEFEKVKTVHQKQPIKVIIESRSWYIAWLYHFIYG